jgi:CDP-4-dehydro-6-deoxyglucose reductase
MPKLLSLSRAARLAGVSRGELQHRIRRQGVETFEGQIAVSTLLELFPGVALDRDPVWERLEQIKARAQPKTRYTDGWLPEPEVLVSRLHELNRVLVRTKTALNAADSLLREIDKALGGAQPALALEALRPGLERLLSRSDSALDPRAQLFVKDMFLKVMTASVKVRPSGHEFFVEGNESILEAGLKAGLHLGYGCSSGNCGRCKARVLSGEVQRIRDHDFVLSERERARGEILACAWTAVTDLELEAQEALGAADLPQQEIRTRVARVEPLTGETAILHLRTPRTQTLRFMAGQGVRLSDEEGHTGRYAVASCPCDGRNLEFLIRRRPGDGFADAVLERRIKTQAVLVRGPYGDFLLQEDSSRPAVFVAFGHQGFAPIKSLLEQAIAIDTAEHLHLYRVDKPLGRDRLDNLCRAWADSLDNFSFTLLDEDLPPSELLTRLKQDIGDLEACHVYAAGPAAPLDDCRRVIVAAGLDPASVRCLAVE